MKYNITDFEYNLSTKQLELYENGELVSKINPIKVIRENIEAKACYLIANTSDFVVFNKQGQDLQNVSIWEIINIWQEKKLCEALHTKYLGEA